MAIAADNAFAPHLNNEEFLKLHVTLNLTSEDKRAILREIQPHNKGTMSHVLCYFMFHMTTQMNDHRTGPGVYTLVQFHNPGQLYMEYHEPGISCYRPNL